MEATSNQTTIFNESLHSLVPIVYEKEIIAFDLAQQEEHKVRKMLLPKGFVRDPNSEVVELSAGDCLLLADFHKTDQYIDVWVMREYDVPDSWTKLFNLKFSYNPKVDGWLGGLFVMETSTLFRICNRRDSSQRRRVWVLYFYNVEGMGDHKMIQYQESLLWIDD